MRTLVTLLMLSATLFIAGHGGPAFGATPAGFGAFELATIVFFSFLAFGGLFALSRKACASSQGMRRASRR